MSKNLRTRTTPEDNGSSLTPPPSLTDEQVREAAILLAASDAVRDDNIVPAASALAFTQGWWDAMDRDPYWKDGGHCGDCTSVPMTCGRCLCERYEQEIRDREARDE